MPKPANTATKDRIVVGLASVSSSVEKYADRRPPAVVCASRCAGALRNVRAPRKHSAAPPPRRSADTCASRKPEMAVSPNPAIHPYAASAVAAPRPVASPAVRPCSRLRRMHSRPIGPTGAAIDRPITSPLIRKLRVMDAALRKGSRACPLRVVVHFPGHHRARLYMMARREIEFEFGQARRPHARHWTRVAGIEAQELAMTRSNPYDVGLDRNP